MRSLVLISIRSSEVLVNKFVLAICDSLLPNSVAPKRKIASCTQVRCQFTADQNFVNFFVMQICCQECHLLLDLKKLLNFLVTLDGSTDITKVINRH